VFFPNKMNINTHYHSTTIPLLINLMSFFGLESILFTPQITSFTILPHEKEQINVILIQ